MCRLCSLGPDAADDLTLIDWATLADSIDEWLKIELQQLKSGRCSLAG